MKIEVEWEKIEAEEDGDNSECLYAYLHTETREILYIGKADGSTIRERWEAEDKESLKKFSELCTWQSKITLICL